MSQHASIVRFGRTLALLTGAAILAWSAGLSGESAAIAAPVAMAGAGLVAYLLHRARRAAEHARGMTNEVKSRWAAANSLADVAELTAQWLTGQLPAQPGYDGPVDVDEDELPGLAGLLAAVCRAGLLTTGSQAGYDGPGTGGYWRQHAAVEGLIGDHDYRRLQRICQQVGLRVTIGGPGVTVTFHNGHAWTTFGAARRDLADDRTGYGICGAAAVHELRIALPIVAYDPEPGRNDRLWPALAGFARQQEPPMSNLKCPTCESPEPRLHPATQAEGEVTALCPDPFHGDGFGLFEASRPGRHDVATCGCEPCAEARAFDRPEEAAPHQGSSGRGAER